MKRIIPLLLLLAACSQRAEEPAANSSQQPAEQPRLAPVENSVAAPALDPKSPEAAAAVLRAYFAAIAEQRYGDAWRLWSDSGRASGVSEAAFAASFADYRTYRGTVGAPGRMEGAAGSSYLEIPVEVFGRRTGGAAFRQSGMMTLRRVNDVPGATAEQLQWRIYKSDLKAGETEASYRFIGRWAGDVRKCGTPWRFTATSLKTPDGAVCSFSKAAEVPGGYDVAGSCTAKGPPKDDLLKLRFAESARALLIESRTLGEAGLVRCP